MSPESTTLYSQDWVVKAAHLPENMANGMDSQCNLPVIRNCIKKPSLCGLLKWALPRDMGKCAGPLDGSSFGTLVQGSRGIILCHFVVVVFVLSWCTGKRCSAPEAGLLWGFVQPAGE